MQIRRSFCQSLCPPILARGNGERVLKHTNVRKSGFTWNAPWQFMQMEKAVFARMTCKFNVLKKSCGLLFNLLYL
jgi:hypothetical protein